MKNIALIPAAGSGTRMDSKTKKQFLNLAGQPLLTRTVLFFNKTDLIDEIIIVVPEDDKDFCQMEIVNKIDKKKAIRLVNGGANRAQSVFNGLKSIPSKGDDIVLVHDGARPFLTQELVKRLVQSLRKNESKAGVIPVVPVKDTIKVVEGNKIISTPQRSKLFAAQTPQCFYVQELKAMFEQLKEQLHTFTDESSIAEYCGYNVQAIKGEENNIKITTPQDLAVAEFLIREGIICLK